MKTPEGLIKDKIRKWLREQGAYVFSPTQTGYGQQTVDLICCVDGKFLAIEVKAPGKKPTARQLIIIDEIIESRGMALVAWSLQDVVEMVQPLLSHRQIDWKAFQEFQDFKKKA